MGKTREGDVSVKGNGNIIGNKNTVKNYRIEHRHTHYHQNSLQSGERGEPGVAVGGMVVAVGFAAWFFVINSEKLYEYLKLASFAYSFPLLGLWVLKFKYRDELGDEVADWVYLSCGVLMAGAAFFLANYGHSQLDPSLVLLSEQHKNPIHFFQQLTGYGYRIVLGCFFGSILIAMTAAFNLFMGLHILALATNLDWLSNKLSIFQPLRTLGISGMFLVLAWAFESRVLFEFFDWRL